MSLSSVLNKDRDCQFPHFLLLEASAGSGKTQALAERFVQFLLSRIIPHHDLSHLLAVTFTKNAAREMKERILEMLKQLALGQDQGLREKVLNLVSSKPDELAARAHEAVDQIIARYSDFQVQTIDSFTWQVLNSSAWELDLRPDLEVCMDYDDLVDYALAMLVKEVGPDKDPELTQMMEGSLRLLNQQGGRSFIWNPESRLRERFTKFLELESKESRRLVFVDYRDQMEDCLQAIRQTYEAITALPLERRKKGESLASHLERRDIHELLKRTYSSYTVPVLKPESKAPPDKMDLFEGAREKWLNLSQVVGRLASCYAQGHYHPYRGPYERFKRSLDLAKQRIGAIHIDDIGKSLSEYLAQEAVIPEVYIWLGERLYHFLIDEFQDTDPIQWASLWPLIEESLAKDGSFFAVGDLKQAIFMFRKADYRIMRDLILQIKDPTQLEGWLPPSVRGRTKLATLGRNYRSGGVILDYVDHVFKGRLKLLVGTDLLKEDLTGLADYEQEPLEKRKDQGYVQVRRFPLDSEDTAEDFPPVREALSKIILDAKSRGVRYREMAILAGENKQLEVTLEWLTEEGIPATASSSLDIRNRRVIAELIELLRFLDSPVDDLAFASFVGGEIMTRATSQEDLPAGPDLLGQLLLEGEGAVGPQGYLYGRFREKPSLQPLWEGYLELLYQKTGYHPLYDLISLALRVFRVFENFPKEAAPLVKFMEAIRSLESRGMNSIRDFLELASKEREELFEMELPEFNDAVQLLTFHKAKGLGFPVVINLLYDSPGRGRDALYYSREGDEVRLFHLDKTSLEKGADFNPELREINDRFHLDERIQELNTLYVACTRAEDELHNLVIIEKEEEGVIGQLFEEIERGRKQAELPQREEGITGPTPAVLPPARIPQEEWKRGDGWSLTRWEESRRGEFYHRVLEQVEFLPEPIAEELSLILGRCQAQEIFEYDLARVRSEMIDFLNHRQVRDWFLPAPERKVLREAEYVDESGQLHRMDRVVLDPDRVQVIDFKTGERQDYTSQMRVYMEILRRVYPDRNTEGYVAYVDSGWVEGVN